MHTPLPDHASLGTGHSRRATPVAEHREAVGERMRAATVTENTGHADDHRGDQDDEPKNDDHDALRRLRRRPTIMGQAPVAFRLGLLRRVPPTSNAASTFSSWDEEGPGSG